MLHELELNAGRRSDHHPHGKDDELAGRQSRSQKAPPVAVGQSEEGAEEVVGGLDVQLRQQLHAKDMEGCLRTTCSQSWSATTYIFPTL